MLLDNFFYIQRIENAAGTLKAFIQINKEHKIFEGHFPSIPIVPGVCMMEMIKEVLEKHFDRKLMLRTGDNLKFLSVINPQQHTELQADIQYEEDSVGTFKISASLFTGAIIFFKIKATLAAA